MNHFSWDSTIKTVISSTPPSPLPKRYSTQFLMPFPPAVAGAETTSFEVQLPLIHAGPYYFIYGIPALVGIDAASNPQELTINRILKIPRLHSTPQFQAGFINMLASLSNQRAAIPTAYTHRHITDFRIIDHMATRGGQCTSRGMGMPWYGNGDILTYRNRFPQVSLLPLVIQVAMGLAHLHHYKVVHGHVHPKNIFITDSGCATITDTSVYTEACRYMLGSHPTTFFETASRYQAPEILWSRRCAFVHPTASSDVYAFASTIYAIFTGSSPFPGRTTEEAVAEILFHGHLHIPKPTAISDDLWDILRRCWAFNAADRLDISDLVVALDDIALYA